MNDFEERIMGHILEIGKQLARLEARINNGMSRSVEEIETWISGHPVKCPVATRKAIYTQPILVAVMAAAGTKLLDLIPIIIKAIK